MEEQASRKARGGFARAAKLNAKQRKAIASEAARARWAERSGPDGPPKMLYKGVLNLAGTRIPCAVIEGPRGIQRVILGGRSGASKRLKAAASEDGALVPIFVAPGQLVPFIDADLRDGPLTPIEYLDGETVERAYDAAILPAVCDVWLRARHAGALQKQQESKAHKAELLMRALAQTGIVALVDEATGYEKIRPQNALQAYLELVIRKELAAWAKKFPDEFYENIYKLRGWKWPGMQKNRFSAVAGYTRDLVYERLGPGVLQELERKSPRNESGNRPNKLHQWLTEDVGEPMLAQHLHALLMFQRLAIANGHSWGRFYQMVGQVLPKRGTNLELPLTYASEGEPSGPGQPA